MIFQIISQYISLVGIVIVFTTIETYLQHSYSSISVNINTAGDLFSRIKGFKEYTKHNILWIKNLQRLLAISNECVPVIHGMFTSAFTYQFVAFIVQECVA